LVPAHKKNILARQSTGKKNEATEEAKLGQKKGQKNSTEERAA